LEPLPCISKIAFAVASPSDCAFEGAQLADDAAEITRIVRCMRKTDFSEKLVGENFMCLLTKKTGNLWTPIVTYPI